MKHRQSAGAVALALALGLPTALAGAALPALADAADGPLRPLPVPRLPDRALLAQAPASPPGAREAPREVALIEGIVEHVHDGDSFRLRAADGRRFGVRLSGIDAPERTQPFANVARRALRDAIERRDVRLEAVKVDPYGRLVGRVFVGGRDIGLELLDEGLAWHFARYDADLAPVERERYARAQADARARRVGLWQQNDPVAPWLFRKERR